MSKQSNKITKIAYPKFNKIVEDCKDKIKDKFPEYGNSWKDTGLIYTDFWEKRLNGEIKEIFELKDTLADNKFNLMKSEIVDAINVLAMMYEHANQLSKKENDIYKRTWRYG